MMKLSNVKNENQEVKDQFYDQVNHHVCINVYHQLHNQFNIQVCNKVRHQFRNQLHNLFYFPINEIYK